MKKGVYRLLNGKLSNNRKVEFACGECDGMDLWADYRIHLNTGENQNGSSDAWGDEFVWCTECETYVHARAYERTAA